MGFDIILGGSLIGAAIVVCLIMMLVTYLWEKAIVKRLKPFQEQLGTFSLSHGWRWFYRCGHRRGKKQGIEIGRQQGQRIEVTNRCRPHAADLYPSVVQLADGRFVQGWFCPDWQAHIMSPPLFKHPIPAATFIQQKEIHQWQVAAVDTQMHAATKPKKVKLS